MRKGPKYYVQDRCDDENRPMRLLYKKDARALCKTLNALTDWNQPGQSWQQYRYVVVGPV